MIRILSLAAVAASLTLASCATAPKKDSCCAKKDAAAEKACCSKAKAASTKCATCEKGKAGHTH